MKHSDSVDRAAERVGVSHRTLSHPPGSGHWLLDLQRAVGNVGARRVVQRVLGAPPVTAVSVPVTLVGSQEQSQIPCRFENGGWVAYLPSGVDPRQVHDMIVDKLGVDRYAVRFTNTAPVGATVTDTAPVKTFVLTTLVGSQEQIQIPCRFENGGWVAYLPSGVNPKHAHDAVVDKLGVDRYAVRFTNMPNDDLKGASEELRQLGGDEKIRLAKLLVERYLTGIGFVTVDTKTVTDFLAGQQVAIPSQSEWAAVVFSQSGSRFRPADIEGLTSRGARGERSVWINGVNHTLPAIVHELFHALEHNALRGLTDQLVEGLTEYFTALATGVEHRCTRARQSIYTDPLWFVRHAVSQRFVTADILREAYFRGTCGGSMKDLEKQYFEFSRQKEMSSRHRG